MHTRLLAGTAALAISVALSGPLAAADYPVKAAPMAAPAVFNWTGFYAGGHLGWASTRFDNFATEGVGKDSRLVGGLHAGYNIQSGNIVWGIEGDLSAVGGGKEARPGGDHALSTDLLASVRGRLGIAFDRVLVYATGGWGFTQGRAVSSSDGLVTHFHKSKPVFGGGIEWAAASNLTYRVEVLDFIGKKTFPGSDAANNTAKNTIVARFGLTYKFDGSGWGKGPIAAKY
jgi:outer membrane immunogenic protein